MWNVENRFRQPLGRLTVRQADGGLEQDAERSKCSPVMGGIFRQVRKSVMTQTFGGSLVM
jgi:hypothetical protein